MTKLSQTELNKLLDSTHNISLKVLATIASPATSLSYSYLSSEALQRGFIIHPSLVCPQILCYILSKKKRKYFAKIWESLYPDTDKWQTYLDQAAHWALTEATERRQEVYSLEPDDNTWPNKRFRGEPNILNYKLFNTIRLVDSPTLYRICAHHLETPIPMYSLVPTRDRALIKAMIIIEPGQVLKDLQDKSYSIGSQLVASEELNTPLVQPRPLLAQLAYAVNHNISTRALNSPSTLYKLSLNTYPIKFEAAQIQALSEIFWRYKKFLLSLKNPDSLVQSSNKNILNRASRLKHKSIQTLPASKTEFETNLGMYQYFHLARFYNTSKHIRPINIRRTGQHPSTWLQPQPVTYDLDWKRSEKYYLDTILDHIQSTKERNWPRHTYIQYPTEWALTLNPRTFLGLPLASRTIKSVTDIYLSGGSSEGGATNVAPDLSIIFEDGNKLGHNNANNRYDGWILENNSLRAESPYHRLGFIILASAYHKGSTKAHISICASNGPILEKTHRLRSRTECIGLVYMDKYYIWNGLWLSSKTPRGGIKYYQAIFDECCIPRLSFMNWCDNAGYETYDPDLRGTWQLKDGPYPAQPTIDLSEYPKVPFDLYKVFDQPLNASTDSTIY